MKKLTVLSEDEVDEVNSLLTLIDIEVGSTICAADNKEKVLQNMSSASKAIKKLRNIIGE